MKKLLDIKAKLAPFLKENEDNFVKCSRFLKKHGFKRLNTSATRTSYSGIVFINHKKRIIVKKSYLCDKKPVDAVPTVVIIDDYDTPWVAQPVVRTVKEEEYDKPEKWRYHTDMHYKNVGYYRNKLVAIDW